MKLLFCGNCADVVKLNTTETRRCACGKSWGRYTDNINAEFGGERAELIGFANSTLSAALAQHRAGDRADGMGHRFEAFIIPKSAPSVRRAALADSGEE